MSSGRIIMLRLHKAQVCWLNGLFGEIILSAVHCKPQNFLTAGDIIYNIFIRNERNKEKVEKLTYVYTLVHDNFTH